MVLVDFKLSVLNDHNKLNLVFLFFIYGQEYEPRDISLSPANVTAVPGICALVSCTSTSPDYPKSIMLHKCINNKNGNENCQTNLQNERITPESVQNTKNCGFIIKTITSDDEGEYEFKVNNAQKIPNSPRLKIIIQGNAARVCTC